MEYYTTKAFYSFPVSDDSTRELLQKIDALEQKVESSDDPETKYELALLYQKLYYRLPYFEQLTCAQLGGRWLSGAAGGNYMPALLMMGSAYDRGDKTFQMSQNREFAIRYYKKAAELGNVEAMYQLGVIYEKYSASILLGKYRTQLEWYPDERDSRDAVRALEWYEKAAAKGHEKAREAADRLRRLPKKYYPSPL